MNQPPAEKQKPQCDYCGAPLSAHYYFCKVCGTPYKTLPSLLSRKPRELTEGETLTKKAPHYATVFWAYLGVILLSAIVSELTIEEDMANVFFIFANILILIVTLTLCFRFGAALKVQLANIGFDKKDAWLGLLLLIPCLGLNWIWFNFLEAMDPDMEFVVRDLISDLGWSLPALTLTLCIMPAINEEIAFRGLMQFWAEGAMKPWRAILLTSALFSGIHFSVLSFPYLLVLGMLLGWTRWRTNSLYPCMLIHFLHNFIVIAYFN